ncbi:MULTISPECIES: DUF4845 domain-containing protein [unclassified Psychrobacter]|uniref:DUF4845 domain-containing protein n=1 Tax=unclassified Psychrobacter TaxID=196806 RepID=UPI0018F60647|nr:MULTISPECIES: DUF4845 domain-containing protein [unclassified Psychrobacter]
MTGLSSGLKAQQGASVTGVIALVIGLVVAGKLLAAIVPAQIGDYQLTKMLESELHEANQERLSAKEFTTKVDKQLQINADYDTTAKEIFTFKDKKVGQLAIHKQYEKTQNFFGNVDIVNRFEGDIAPTAAE